MSRFFSLIFILICLTFSVNATTTCICEIGLEPVSEQKLFRAGCKVWFSRQKNCSQTKIVQSGYDYINEIQKNNSSSVHYKIGYVGHWNSSKETVHHINTYMQPLIKNGNSIYFDNTSCLSQENADYVLQYLKTLPLHPSQVITVKGNQAVSIGMWDTILADSANFWAITSSQMSKPLYPKCKNQRGHSCMRSVQLKESGLCTENNGQLTRLYCKELQANSDDPYGSKTPSYGWID